MQTFTKAERLSGKTSIDEVYKKGRTILLYPFKISLLDASKSEVPVKIIISVPKRSFKRAVDRNKIKRLIREAYRKNKTILYEGLNTRQLFLMIIYTSKTIESYQEIEGSIIILLQKICKSIRPST
jgi:ribonuclease P protein component